MDAKILKQVSNARNYSGEKETTDNFKAVTIHEGEIRVPVEVRVYMGRSSSASKVYASIWVHDSTHNIFTSGKGSAGGYGYHKTSAAVDEAIQSAGIELSQGISGVGDSAIKEALVAIVRALGYTGPVEVL